MFSIGLRIKFFKSKNNLIWIVVKKWDTISCCNRCTGRLSCGSRNRAHYYKLQIRCIKENVCGGYTQVYAHSNIKQIAHPPQSFRRLIWKCNFKDIGIWKWSKQYNEFIMVDFKFIAQTPSVQKWSLTKFPMLHGWSKVTGMSSLLNLILSPNENWWTKQVQKKDAEQKCCPASLDSKESNTKAKGYMLSRSNNGIFQ